MNRFRLVAAIAAARLLWWIVAAGGLALRFLIIVRACAVVGVILMTQGLWRLRWAVVLGSAFLAILMLCGGPQAGKGA